MPLPNLSRRSHVRLRAILVALLLVTLLFVPHPQRAAATDDPFAAVIQHDLQFAAQQLNATASKLSTKSYPELTKSDGSWSASSASSWTSGFFTGALWSMYQATGNAAWLTRAQNWQAGLEGQKTRIDTHDVGFIIFNSFGNGYRLTGNDAYHQIILTAAGSLAQRFNPTVGCIRSHGSISDESNFEVIIDNMMNLELLFWASKHGGKAEWYDMAVSHALKTMTNNMRPDGSIYQVVNYNPTNGAVTSKATKQGYAPESTWSRGQAWAVYGFTMAYRETGDPRFLETARKAADYFITHLPDDKVPYWDFQAPNIPNEPRDSSAAAVAASGLIELSQRETDTQRQENYLAAAKDILTSLSSSAYLAEGTTNQAILLHGTKNKPSGTYNTGLIYGDYYFLEALLRYPTTPPPPSDTRIKNVTFEDGSLTHATSGVDRIKGTVTLITAGSLKGTYSARIPNVSSAYLEEDIAAADDIYVSLYLRLDALPKSDTRILQLFSGSTSVGNIVLRSNGALLLRNGSTRIGADSSQLHVGTTYRIGIHQKKGSGAHAILEAYVVGGDTVFTTPFASSETQKFTSAATRLRLGATSGTLNAVFDDIKLDTGALP